MTCLAVASNCRRLRNRRSEDRFGQVRQHGRLNTRESPGQTGCLTVSPTGRRTVRQSSVATRVPSGACDAMRSAASKRPDAGKGQGRSAQRDRRARCRPLACRASAGPERPAQRTRVTAMSTPGGES